VLEINLSQQNIFSEKICTIFRVFRVLKVFDFLKKSSTRRPGIKFGNRRFFVLQGSLAGIEYGNTRFYDTCAQVLSSITRDFLFLASFMRKNADILKLGGLVLSSITPDFLLWV